MESRRDARLPPVTGTVRPMLQLGCGWRAAETGGGHRHHAALRLASIGLRMESRRDGMFAPPLAGSPMVLQLGCGWRAAETALGQRAPPHPHGCFNWAADGDPQRPSFRRPAGPADRSFNWAADGEPQRLTEP